ncbi:MAG: 50S ribosomal protein L18 [Candidatus Hydrogenedentota bacterium]|nr:MAG: 50S ribosomal protein L18 [Candidatus Hydrogenedentota bacterium]
MAKVAHKVSQLGRRKRRVRKKISGNAERPRLMVRRSLKHIYAQLIDDVNGVTLAQASSVSLKISGGNIEAAKEVGKSLAEAAKANSVESACFDRNGRLFHGRIKALADSAREAGLKV